MFDLPSLGLVIGTAIVDSINPCAIGVLVLLIAMVIGRKSSTKRLVMLGGGYIIGIWLTYFGAGFGLIYIFKQVPSVWAEYLALLIGVLVVLVGVLQIKDYFWYGKGISLKIPGSVSEKIQYHSKHNKTFIGIGLLGVLVALVELVCTGAPYFAIVAILKSKPLIETTVMLGLYNLIFIIPLAVILVVVASGTKISVIAKWKDESKESTRLYSGILLAGLGWILILIANGTLKIG